MASALDGRSKERTQLAGEERRTSDPNPGAERIEVFPWEGGG